MLSQSLKIKYFYAKLLLITQYYSHCAKDWFHSFFLHHKMAPLNCIEKKCKCESPAVRLRLFYSPMQNNNNKKKKTREEGIEDFKYQIVLLNHHSKTTEGLSRDLSKVAIFVHNFKSMVKEQWSFYLWLMATDVDMFSKYMRNLTWDNYRFIFHIC